MPIGGNLLQRVADDAPRVELARRRLRRGLPRNIARVAGLSSLGAPVPPPPKSPPSRQCTELEPDARNFTQPSSTSWLVERSVVSGLTNELPENGSRTNVPNDASFDVTASITACWRAPRVKSVSDGSSTFSRIRE